MGPPGPRAGRRCGWRPNRFQIGQTVGRSRRSSLSASACRAPYRTCGERKSRSRRRQQGSEHRSSDRRYGIVADLFAVVPALTQIHELRRNRALATRGIDEAGTNRRAAVAGWRGSSRSGSSHRGEIDGRLVPARDRQRRRDRLMGIAIPRRGRSGAVCSYALEIEIAKACGSHAVIMSVHNSRSATWSTSRSTTGSAEVPAARRGRHERLLRLTDPRGSDATTATLAVTRR